LSPRKEWKTVAYLFIGENPKAGRPSCLTNLESVAAGKTSNLMLMFLWEVNNESKSVQKEATRGCFTVG
jgi:hypothetical protein